MTEKKIGLLSAVSIGIGGMVGGGIFAAVNAANLRLFRQTRSRWWLPLVGTVACAAALVLLLAQTVLEKPWKIAIPAAILSLSFLIEIAYRSVSGRTLKRTLAPRNTE